MEIERAAGVVDPNTTDDLITFKANLQSMYTMLLRLRDEQDKEPIDDEEIMEMEQSLIEYLEDFLIDYEELFPLLRV